MLEPNIQVSGWRGGDGDASYLDKTLLHNPMEIGFDESVGGLVFLRFWGRAAAVASVWFVFFFMLWLMNDGPTGSVDAFGGTSSPDYALLAVATWGSFLIYWIVFLFSELQEPIGEWRVLLADRAPAKPYVYSQIAGRIRDRGLPMRVSLRRIRTGLHQQSIGDRVIVEDGHYFAYISVFEYGSSLYLGWMMWRKRRGFVLVGRFVSDLFASIFNGLDPVRLMLRTERPRAMREAVHSVAREGLHVAIEGLLVPEAYGFPGGLPPIEDSTPAMGMAAPQSVPASLAQQAMPPGLAETGPQDPSAFGSTGTQPWNG
jgi:hypothetical protein